jgi:hypothetical protein
VHDRLGLQCEKQTSTPGGMVDEMGMLHSTDGC